MLGEYFDPEAELVIHERLRPHWSQAGAIVFVTFRTVDSIPASVVQRWEREKQEWVLSALQRNGQFELGAPIAQRFGPRGNRNPRSFRERCRPRPPLDGLMRIPIHGTPPQYAGECDREMDAGPQHWSRLLPLLSPSERHAFTRHFNRCREVTLDECRGACVLKRHDLAQIVADTLLHFDGQRYRMGDFIIMPNHVHLLVAFGTSQVMERQFDSWLHYSAAQINRLIGSRGRFWQQEPFDCLVRSPEQYNYFRAYIASNPAKARLNPGEYLFRRYLG